MSTPARLIHPQRPPKPRRSRNIKPRNGLIVPLRTADHRASNHRILRQIPPHHPRLPLPPVPPPSPSSATDKWFNLTLPDRPAALPLFRQANLDPLIVDIILTQSAPNPRIVERWVVQYDARKTINIGTESHSTYKSAVVLLRSLYATVRILPAYKLFRAVSYSGLEYRISPFVEPFTRAEDAEMRQFVFAPVETPCGRLSVSVSYVPVLEDASTPLSTELITDYVGSPKTEPVKRFTRRHSWSNGREGGTSDSRPLKCNPPVHTEGGLARRRSTGFNGNWPMPPVHVWGGRPPGGLLRAESAPVSIPLPQFGKSSGLPPSSSRKVTRPGYFSQAVGSPESKRMINREPMRFLDFRTDSSLQKVLSIGREDIANIFGLYGAPQIVYSRSHSRLTFVDDYDDPEFAFPFAVDDDDLIESCNRINSSNVKDHESDNSDSRGLLLAKMSPDAAIGALVRMFKAAPSLQRDTSTSDSTMKVSIDDILKESVHDDKDMDFMVEKLDVAKPSVEIVASGLFKSKTVADAFVELRHYKELKELLLRQGGLRSVDND